MAVSNMANSGTFKVTTPSDREIRVTRVFDAPRHVVFEAITKPEHIRQWWGCLDKGYSVPVCEVDLRPGGMWRFVTRTPKGQFVTFYGVYHESTPPDRMVYTEIFEGVSTSPPDVGIQPQPASSPDDSVVTAVLTDENGKTRLTLSCLYPSLEVRDVVLKSGMETGAAISYDRLDDLVRQLQRGL
jgi:uncharacterized protein YndB with AHSA1/START domain